MELWELLCSASVCRLSMALQVLVCTSTLAWGVNLPAHLVVIKVYILALNQCSDFVSAVFDDSNLELPARAETLEPITKL